MHYKSRPRHLHTSDTTPLFKQISGIEKSADLSIVTRSRKLGMGRVLQGGQRISQCG